MRARLQAVLQFRLDDCLEALKYELLYAYLHVVEDGRGLIELFGHCDLCYLCL